jgi:2-methylcitrate dehydratase
MIRWLDFNDAISGALTTHPSDSLSAVLMVADHLSRQRTADRKPPLIMRDVFDAMVKVYEIEGALGLLNDWRKYGIDQPLLARVATAPVIARMLGASREEVLSAVSNAFIDSSLSVVRNAPNIGPRKNWATADANHAAVRLACRDTSGRTTSKTNSRRIRGSTRFEPRWSSSPEILRWTRVARDAGIKAD